MTEEMPEACKSELMTLVSNSPKREICGFIMRDWIVQEIANISLDDHAFQMDPEQQLHMIVDHKPDIIGIYHSHPSGSYYPSDKDIENAPSPNKYRYWIVTMAEVREWRIENGCAATTIEPANLAPAIHIRSAEVRQAADPDLDASLS